MKQVNQRNQLNQIDLTRLKRVMLQASHGEELTIGFLGGSITQGSLASQQENTYAYRVLEWWKQTFLKAKFHYVNGGIGGTSSYYGVTRAVTDLLMYQPDFVVVDFSVNDTADSFFQETYEGLIRKLLTWNSKPAIVLLHNVFYDTGISAQEYHQAVGQNYNLPCISIRDTVYQRIKAGELKRIELTSDGLHPNDRGHELVAEEIIRFLEMVKKEECEGNKLEKEEWGYGADEILPKPITANRYEQAERLTIRNSSPRLLGFLADTEEKMGHLDAFKNGWIGKQAGDRIVFEVKGDGIALQYRKSLKKPALRALAILDNDREHAVLLDGNFEEDWGDCQYLQVLLHHGENRMHQVEVEVLPSEAKEAVAFYLMGVIVA